MVRFSIGKVEYKPNQAGLREVMKSGPVAAMISRKADEIAGRATQMAGDKSARYGSRVRIQRISAHGYVFTGNYPAIVDQARSDTLHKAI